MSRYIKFVALAHSKLRNAIGAVGIEVDPVKQEIYVKMAKNWERRQLNEIAPDLRNMYEKFEWFNTIIDVRVGEHVIQDLRRIAELPIKVIDIRPKVTDTGEIRRVKSLDLIEMVQYMLQLKLIHKILFPKNPTPAVTELEEQIALYAEHATEAGGINYYAPGDELDNLTKALMTGVFAARPYMSDSVEIVCGPMHPKKTTTFEDVSAMDEPKIKRKRVIRGI